MSRTVSPGPYEMHHERGGPYLFHEPVTGFRVEERTFGDAMAAMHRLLLDRREELRAREAASLDAQERRELDRLLRYTDFFLYGGLACGGDASAA